MVTIAWGYFPTEVRKAVRPIILANLDLLPPWCTTLHLSYQKDGDVPEAHAMCYTNDQYLDMSVVIHAEWLDNGPELRTRYVIHELAHGILAVMASSFRRNINYMKEHIDNPLFFTVLENEWTRAVETTTQQLAEIIFFTRVDRRPVPFREIENDSEQPALEPFSFREGDKNIFDREISRDIFDT